MSFSPETAQKIHASFADQSMMQTFGATIEEIQPGRVTLVAPILPGCQQQHGFGHAALSFGLGDSAAGYAALTVMPPECEVLTSEMKINLLAPASGQRLRAVGRVIKAGRRLVVVQADVYAQTGDDEKHIALLTGTMIPIQPT